jgi:zinc-ribbon domain
MAIVMLELMTIRCDQCGHENNPNYRFCGMCGAPLKVAAPPRAEAVPERTRQIPLTGPSFLGLGDETSSRDFDYLLEEEEPSSSHAAFYIVLLLVIGGIGFSVWRWHDDLYAWAARFARAQISSNTPAPAPPASTTTTPPPAAADSPNEPHSATVTEQDQSTAKPAGADSAAASPPSAAQNQPAATNRNPGANAENAASPGETSNPEKQPAAEAKAQEGTDESAPSESASPPSTSRQADNPGPKETAEAAPTPKAARPKPSAAIPTLSEDDRVVSEGERYLYGTGGVRPDCDRAQRDLMAGARASNTKAFTLLGAMYATGHCVSRDLPSAYRWFARALHQDPSNVRLERNLEVIWRQMTPEEKQIAQKNQAP